MAIVTLNDGENAGTFRGYLNAMFVELFQILTGKAGGGTIIGSTTTDQDLNLRSNAIDLTTGSVNVLDSLEAASVDVAALTCAGGVAVKKNLRATNAYLVTPTNTAGSVVTTNGAQTLTGKIIQPSAGSAVAGTAPIKLTTGALLGTAEAGAVEFLTDKLYFTPTTGPTRREVALADTGYGGFWAYNKAATMIIPIGTATKYHAIRSINAGDIVTGLVNGFTFNQGRQVDADIANILNGAGGRLEIECSGPHNLTTGDIVVISNENRVAGHNMVTKITVVGVSTTNFTCDQIAYAGGTQTSTGIITEPAYLQASAGSTGIYNTHFTCAFSATNARVIKMELNVGVTPADNCVAERTATGTIDTFGSNGNVSVTAGDRLFITVSNAGGTEDVTVTHCNLNLHRV